MFVVHFIVYNFVCRKLVFFSFIVIIIYRIFVNSPHSSFIAYEYSTITSPSNLPPYQPNDPTDRATWFVPNLKFHFKSPSVLHPRRKLLFFEPIRNPKNAAKSPPPTRNTTQQRTNFFHSPHQQCTSFMCLLFHS